MDYESVESFAKEIFHVIWYKHGLSLSAFSSNEALNNHAQFHCAEVTANAVICKQHIYRVLYKDFFIRNFPDFIVTKILFRKFVFDLTRQICTYPEYDFFEKLWNTCAFVAEMHLFCLSRALDVDLKAAPGLWTEVIQRYLQEDFFRRSLDEVANQATSRYSKLYSLLEPFMLPRTPYRTVLLIDHLSTMLRDTTVISKTEGTPDDLPDEIFLLLRELCFALEASDELISMIKLEHFNKIEVTPPIPEHDYKFLDAVLFNLAPVTEEDAVEDSDSIIDVATTASIESNASGVKTADPTVSLVPTSNSEICDIQGGKVKLQLSDSQSAPDFSMASTSRSDPTDRLLEILETGLATAAKQSNKDSKSKESSSKSTIGASKNLGKRGTSIQPKEPKIKTVLVEQGRSIGSVKLKTQTRKSFPAYASRSGTKSKDFDNADKPEIPSKKLSVDVKSIPKTRSTVGSLGAKSAPKTETAVSTLEEKKTRITRSPAPSSAASTLKTRSIASSSVALSTPTTRSTASSSVALSTPKTRSTASSSVALSTPKTRSAVSSTVTLSTPKTRNEASSSAATSTPKTRSAVSSSVATSTPKTRSKAFSSDAKPTPKK